MRVFLFAAMFVSCVVVAQGSIKHQLLGQYYCQHTIANPQTNIKFRIDYDVDVKDNGQAEGKGYILAAIEGLPVIKYSVNNTITWHLVDNKLTLTTQSAYYKNISHPQLDLLIDIKKILPSSIEETVEIIELDKQQITVKSMRDNNRYQCIKRR